MPVFVLFNSGSHLIIKRVLDHAKIDRVELNSASIQHALTRLTILCILIANWSLQSDTSCWVCEPLDFIIRLLIILHGIGNLLDWMHLGEHVSLLTNSVWYQVTQVIVSTNMTLSILVRDSTSLAHDLCCIVRVDWVGRANRCHGKFNSWYALNIAVTQVLANYDTFGDDNITHAYARRFNCNLLGLKIYYILIIGHIIRHACVRLSLVMLTVICVLDRRQGLGWNLHLLLNYH